jgi:cephalosporin-C deacetylase
MADDPEVILSQDVTIAQDSTLTVSLGELQPGFYEVRLRDSIRWNIGVRPDAVVSLPDAQPDFDAFWDQTLAELEQIPLEAVWTEIPEFSNEKRTCYEVRYPSLGGGIAGGIISIPVADGKYPVCLQYMGYGAPVYYFDPNAAADRIEYAVSIRDQGIFKGDQDRWIDRGLGAKETFYYRGAFADAKRAVDFVASLDKADPDHIVALGESQGGALTFVAAALDDRIKAIGPAVPFLGDYPDYAKIVYWPVHEVFEQADEEGIDRDELFRMLSYFDVKNFAPRIHCPVYMAFGLQDPTCPPHTNFSIYNNLGTKDKRYYCVPECGHAMWQVPAWAAERDAFLSAF